MFTSCLGVIEHLFSNHRGKSAADSLFTTRSNLHNTSSMRDQKDSTDLRVSVRSEVRQSASTNKGPGKTYTRELPQM